MAIDRVGTPPRPQMNQHAPSDTGGYREIELKLQGAPKDLAAIFGRLQGERRAPTHVISTYYDTADDRLWRHGYTLRLREKNSGHELTLKQERTGAVDRGEWTTQLAEPVPDLGLLPPDAPRGEIGAVLPEELEPRFVSDVERTKADITAEDATIEVSLDTGRIVAGDREQPVAELEFELLSGPVRDMLRHLRTLSAHHPLALATHSKAARGKGLSNGSAPEYVKGSKPNLVETDTIESAMAKVVSVAVSQIMGNLAAAADGRDPEGVHQLRVGLRRFRSAMSLFKPYLSPQATALEQTAKQALNRLGPARDLDVFLLETMPPVLADDPRNPGLLRLVETAEAKRRAAYDDVRSLISDPQFTGLQLDLMIAIESGGLVAGDAGGRLAPIARMLLQKRHAKVLKLGRRFEKMPNAERHAVRIALKKLRYACDYFQGLYQKKATPRYLRRLADLQDDLGRLNDVAVAEQLVDALAGENHDAAIGAALIKGWYRHRLHTVEPQMRHSWREFTEAKTFWRA